MREKRKKELLKCDNYFHFKKYYFWIVYRQYITLKFSLPYTKYDEYVDILTE